MRKTGGYRIVSAQEAARQIRSGDNIHLGSVAGVPGNILKAICARGDAGELRDVRFYHIHTAPTCDYADRRYEGIFESNNFFIGDNMRRFIHAGCADYVPVSLHENALLYREKRIPLQVALVQVSPPDARGRVSLGTSVDITRVALEQADLVIAAMNPHVPFTLGDALIPEEWLDFVVPEETPVETWEFPAPNEVDRAIARHCAGLIEDGACLQLGIGSLPNAVLSELAHHRNLGLHTEMFACGVLPLVEKGVINGANKAIDQGKIVASFLMGPRKLYDFAANNETVEMRSVEYTNDPFVIARNPKVVAINSAIEIDLTGQVCADSVGEKMYSGAGGQLDFIYGASRSEGGKAIIAVTSRTGKGRSKIVPTLQPGAGVVTPRMLARYVVTEYGVVDLSGRTLRERARLLISIAAPEHREMLERAAFARYGR